MQNRTARSPPSARGNLSLSLALEPIPPITPALLGETEVVDKVAMPSYRSPPHARGNPESAILAMRDVPITPARAGKPTSITELITPSTDHPRMRGETTNCNRLINFGFL